MDNEEIKEYPDKFIQACPVCKGQLEFDWEYHYKHYGELDPERLNPDEVFVWCPNDDLVFDGSGREA